MKRTCTSKGIVRNPTWKSFKALCSVVEEPVDPIRDLGVFLNSELLMAQHTGKLSSIFFLQLCKLRHMLNSLSMQRLISTFIMSRLDYCNTVLAGLSANTFAPLQSVLNATVRLMVSTATGNRIGDVMQSLQLVADCLLDSLQNASADASHQQRYQSRLHRRHYNTDIIASWSPQASCHRNKPVRDTSYSAQIWWQGILCCWTTEMEPTPTSET